MLTTDGGENWHEATLEPQPDRYAWVGWTLQWVRRQVLSVDGVNEQRLPGDERLAGSSSARTSRPSGPPSGPARRWPPLLEEVGVLAAAVEVVFAGIDVGIENDARQRLPAWLAVVGLTGTEDRVLDTQPRRRRRRRHHRELIIGETSPTTSGPPWRRRSPTSWACRAATRSRVPVGSRCTTGPLPGTGTTFISWRRWSGRTGGAST